MSELKPYAMMFDGHNSIKFRQICNEFTEEYWSIAPINDDYTGIVLRIRDIVIYPGQWVIFTQLEIIMCEAKCGVYGWNRGE